MNTQLSWSDHINYVLTKISKNNGILSKIRFCIDKTVALMLYYSLIYPYLSYCNIVWASNYTSRLKSLHISQKRSIRILFNIPPSSSSKPSFYENSILNIYQTNDFLTAIFMYKYANNLLPHSFKNFFTRSSDIHSYCLRSADKFRPEASRTMLKKFSLKCSGPRIFSSIPITITSSKSISIFKSTYKSYILSK